ncbi:MAG TPA: endo alpha-1,4 polygalactosaminidase [Kofleriaceae bacterium]|jgi:hypothetical protein|nr:endo alpha-1,4 polygalactosaminidase [Kofleriaceae bacterium]
MTLAVLTAGLAACDDGRRPLPEDDAAVAPTWWKPVVGQVKNWDIQLSAKAGDIDVSMPRVMYDLDLWSLVPTTMMLDYGDGTPVMVPPGALAGVIAQLHARTPSTMVICHVETGLWEASRPDAAKFPGAGADPTQIPDNPDMPAMGSVVGWSLGSADHRLLDTSAASRKLWEPILLKRFDLAQRIGCDGIEPAHADAGIYTSGFTVPTEDIYSWYGEIAMQGHTRVLSTGMKNGDLVASAIDMGASIFDWLMIERCGENMSCDVVKPFLALDKPVLAIEYSTDDGANMDPPRDPMPQSAAGVCDQQNMAGIPDGIYKDVQLTGAVRTQCVP